MPSSHLGWNCAAGPCAATGFSVGCGAGLVSAVLDKTLGVGNSVGFYLDYFVDGLLWMCSMLVWKGLPSLLNNDAYFVFWIARAPRDNGRLIDKKTFFPDPVFWSFGKSYLFLWVLPKDTTVSLDWSGRHPGPPSNNLDVEVFNVGGFLTHGDHVLNADADFIAVVEHRLVPARARSVRARGFCRQVLAQFGLLLALKEGMLVMLV